MTDDPLDRAVDARIDAFRPDTLPPFTVIEGRKRARDRRRMAVGAGALSLVALAGAGLVLPALTGGGDRLTPGQVAGGVTRTAFEVQYDPAAGPVGRGRADSDPVLARCLALPGAQNFSTTIQRTDPPTRLVAVEGTEAQAAAVRDCLAGIEGVAVRTVPADTEPPSAVQPIAWTGAQVCGDVPDGECRRLGADDARALHQALAVDSRKEVDPNVIYDCVKAPKVYRMTFEHPSVRAAPITVPTVCGPMRIGDRAYEVDQATRDAVKAAFEAGGPADVPTSGQAQEQTVTGRLRVTGGPAGTKAEGVPGQVTFESGNGRKDVAAADDGTFRVLLPAGTWTVTATSPNFGAGACRADAPIVVDDRTVSDVLVSCPRR